MAKAQKLILVVEDNDEDYQAFLRAVRDLPTEYAVHRCSRGEEALDFLYQRGTHIEQAGRAWPSLILLDLNLPDISGYQILEQIKTDQQLRRIPTIVITTSANPRDVDDCYARGANSYQVKTLRFDKFKQSVQLLMDYWLKAVALPQGIST